MCGVPRMQAIYLFENLAVGQTWDFPMKVANSARVSLFHYRQKYGGQYRSKTLSKKGEKFVRIWRLA